MKGRKKIYPVLFAEPKLYSRFFIKDLYYQNTRMLNYNKEVSMYSWYSCQCITDVFSDRFFIQFCFQFQQSQLNKNIVISNIVKDIFWRTFFCNELSQEAFFHGCFFLGENIFLGDIHKVFKLNGRLQLSIVLTFSLTTIDKDIVYIMYKFLM